MIVISPEMFETMTKRALKLATLQFEQIAFDMPDENKAQIRDMVIEELTDRIIERCGGAANEFLNDRDARRNAPDQQLERQCGFARPVVPKLGAA
jgi:hypothetical protein